MDKNVQAGWAFAAGGFSDAPKEPQRDGKLLVGVTVIICTYRRATSIARFLNSLAVQELGIEALIVVDASPDDQTERALRGRCDLSQLANQVCYFRVAGPLKGLTRQRNFGLRWVRTDLFTFFDDDIVLLPGCLTEMEGCIRSGDKSVVGVAAWIENELVPPTALWKLRRFLGVVSHLRAGSYHRSGLSVPLGFSGSTHGPVSVDWIYGGATMWRALVVREVGFCEAFDGYAQGEDLEFSLRAGKLGALLLLPVARALHFPDPSGRPDFFRLGYTAIRNRYHIHRSCLDNRTWRDIAWFIYAWSVDSVLLTRLLLKKRTMLPALNQLAGRAKAAIDIITRQHASISEDEGVKAISVEVKNLV